MEDIDVICFAYIYGGYRCNFVLFTFMEDIDVIFVYMFTFMEDIDVIFVYIYGGYRCNLFCLFMEDTFMEDIDVFCFVYIYGGYRCILFCLHLWRISM